MTINSRGSICETKPIWPSERQPLTKALSVGAVAGVTFAEVRSNSEQISTAFPPQSRSFFNHRSTGAFASAVRLGLHSGLSSNGGRMRHAETEGFSWHQHWAAPDYLRLLALAAAIAYGVLQVMGQV